MFEEILDQYDLLVWSHKICLKFFDEVWRNAKQNFFSLSYETLDLFDHFNECIAKHLIFFW